MTSQLMAGKRGLIMGVANDGSIAWGIAKALHGAGAEIAFTYQGDALKKRVDPLAASVNSPAVLACDVTDPVSTTFSPFGAGSISSSMRSRSRTRISCRGAMSIRPTRTSSSR